MKLNQRQDCREKKSEIQIKVSYIGGKQDRRQYSCQIK